MLCDKINLVLHPKGGPSDAHLNWCIMWKNISRYMEPINCHVMIWLPVYCCQNCRIWNFVWNSRLFLCFLFMTYWRFTFVAEVVLQEHLKRSLLELYANSRQLPLSLTLHPLRIKQVEHQKIKALRLLSAGHPEAQCLRYFSLHNWSIML